MRWKDTKTFIKHVGNNNHTIVEISIIDLTGKSILSDQFMNKQNTIKLDKYISIDWKNRIVLSSGSKAKSFEVAIEKKEWGNIFHDLLSGIKRIEDFEELKKKIENNILLSNTLKTDILSKLNILSKNDIFKEILDSSWKSLNEKDIILGNNKVIRPDKVLIKDHKAKIVEYKTGLENESHKIQLKKYSKALESMGFTIDSQFLIYINNDVKIVQI